MVKRSITTAATRIIKLRAVATLLSVLIASDGATSMPFGLQAVAGATRCPAASPTARLSASIIRAQRSRIELNVNWSLDQQDQDIRPTDASIIAVLIGLNQQYQQSSNVSIEENAPLAGFVRFVFTHNEQYPFPADARFIVSITFKRHGSAHGLPRATKEFVLRVIETR